MVKGGCPKEGRQERCRTEEKRAAKDGGGREAEVAGEGKEWRIDSSWMQDEQTQNSLGTAKAKQAGARESTKAKERERSAN